MCIRDRSLIGLHTEYDNHEAAVKQAADSVDFLAGKAAEAHLRESQGLNSGFLQVIEPARIPTDPTPSQTVRLALVGAVLAFLAGIVLAFVLEFLGAARQDSPAGRRPPSRASGQ